MKTKVQQVAGQIDIFAYVKERRRVAIFHCGQCVCDSCLYKQSGRCPYGRCYDDKRAKENPYDKAHPDKPPRKAWSNWNKPGEQAHWCRGGIFYPEYYCEHFVKFEGVAVEECVDCNIVIYQEHQMI